MTERVTPEEAVARLGTRDRLGIPLATGQPSGFIEALATRDDWEDLRISGGLLTSWSEAFKQNGVHYLSGFYGPMERMLRDSGANISFSPADFRRFTPLLQALKPRVMATMASPPDDEGWCSLSLHAGATYAELRRAGSDSERMLVVEVSEAFPRTCGLPPDYTHAIHVDEVDLLVSSDKVPPELPDAEPDDIDRAIAEHARGYVHDGCTLQTGIGSIPSTIVGLLAHGDGGDYGVHSEMFTTGLMHLHQAGKVTNQKGIFDGVSVATFAMGTNELYDWLKGNDDVAFLPVDQVNAPELIARNRNAVTINGAITIDIHGQVVADTIAGAQFSGIGGHEDFVGGPGLDITDRSLLCLRSTATVGGQAISRIVPWFEAGTVITTPRHQVDVVVTEYGCAELQGKTVHGRGEALAAIAHPDFREGLHEAASRASGGRSPVR